MRNLLMRGRSPDAIAGFRRLGNRCRRRPPSHGQRGGGHPSGEQELIMAELFIPGDSVGALEEAAVTVGRLDAALAANPLRRAWTFWSELDAARRHAEADGRKVDLFRLAAHLHGLPLQLGDITSAPERGREIAGLNYAVELRSWMAAPDPEQVRLRDIALDSLRAEEHGQPVLAAAARGMLNWLAGRGSRPAIRAAVPLYLRDRGITIHALAAVTGGDALRAEIG